MLSNILPPAIRAIRPLCVESLVTITIQSQPQDWFSDDVPSQEARLETKALIQTATPTRNEILTHTVSSVRQFKLYFTSDLDILSSLQQEPHQLITSFTYKDPIQAQVVGFSDYRYNGWITLLVSQFSIGDRLINLNDDVIVR